MRLPSGWLTCALPLALQLAGCGGAGETAGPGGTTSTPTTTVGAGGSRGATTSSTTGSGGSTTSSSSSSSSSSTGGQSGCLTDKTAGHHKVPCDGGVTYDVEIPTGCASSGCGLILDVHGWTMNADSEDKGTSMRAHGQQHGYVVIQPTAPGIVPTWDQPTHAPLVFAFVSEVAAALGVDKKRIHSMGFSQGGGMTWRMVCAHADVFASASPLSGLPGCEYVAPNAPSREVPILQVHGHFDNVLNFATYAIPERDAALAFWKYGAGSVFKTDPAYKATRYLTAAGTPLEFWEHDYQAGSVILGGHCFPSGTDSGSLPIQFGCLGQGQFNYGEMAMQWFLDHPMP